jgi:hypothetical protein
MTSTDAANLAALLERIAIALEQIADIRTDEAHAAASERQAQETHDDDRDV